MAPRECISVVAALIQRDGKLLICQRRKDDLFGLKWEFPGGKIHFGELPKTALERELREELGVRAEIGREVYRTRHFYAEHSREVELIFFLAEVGEQPVVNLAFEKLLWEEASSLSGYDFLAADKELVSLLATGKLRIL